MKIRLIDFWPNAVTRQTFVFRALLGYLKTPLNLSVYSVYRPRWLRAIGWMGLAIDVFMGRQRDRKLKKNYDVRGLRNVWWTGENVRPPLEKRYHHFISFDQDSHKGRNTYFPLFYIDALLPSQAALDRIGINHLDVSQLLKPRKDIPSDLNTKGLACAFINNPEPTRLAAIEELSGYGRVDVYGAFTGRSVGSKIEIASNYRFVICFENDIYPGYITEKLLDAYLCNAVPLYWGDLGREEHINRRSFINLNDFSSLEGFVRFVSGMTDEEYMDVYREPLLRSIPSITPLLDALLGPGRRDT